jgi:hypothetical protein
MIYSKLCFGDASAYGIFRAVVSHTGYFILLQLAAFEQGGFLLCLQLIMQFTELQVTHFMHKAFLTAL